MLFEETDGVYVKLWEKDRKGLRQDKAEIKIGIACEGWKKTRKDRYILPDKVLITDVKDLIRYYENNREELLHTSRRDLDCRIHRKDWNTVTWGQWRTMCGACLRDG